VAITTLSFIPKIEINAPCIMMAHDDDVFADLLQGTSYTDEIETAVDNNTLIRRMLDDRGALWADCRMIGLEDNAHDACPYKILYYTDSGAQSIIWVSEFNISAGETKKQLHAAVPI
jgi:hypothetical protein